MEREWKWREPFVDMTTVLKEGKLGRAEVRFHKLDKMERAIGQIHGCSDPGELVVELLVGGCLMMSDTPDEQYSNNAAVHHAHGRVLIGGLGMGFLLLPVLRKPEVEHVTVVELESDVIDFIGPQIGLAAGDDARKLQFVNADVLAWKPPKGSKWNTIWMDIWENICTDNLGQYAALNRKFSRYLDRTDEKCWMGAWKQEWLRSQARSERRREAMWP